LSCDGNNVLDVYTAAVRAAERCRLGGGPVFLEAETFRMGGHATHDEAEARATFPAELFAKWGKRDPIGLYETWLVESGPRLAEGRGGKDNRRLPQDVEEQIIAQRDAAAQEGLRGRRPPAPPPPTA